MGNMIRTQRAERKRRSEPGSSRAMAGDLDGRVASDAWDEYRPGPPSAPWVNLKGIGHGVMFEGSRGILVADFTSRTLIPIGDAADLTYYASRPMEQLIPPMGDFVDEWIEACKGSLKTSCNFDTAAGWNWISEVPEPATLSLLMLGGFAMVRRRRR